jgi:hypothetical protein
MSMGLDLILVHNHGRGFQTDSLYVNDRLGLDQDYKLFAQIDNKVMGDKDAKQLCQPHPVPPGFKVMVLDEESGWKQETTTVYGEALTYILAKEIAAIKPVRPLSDWNARIMAMVKLLPLDFPIILWWH